MALNTQRTSRSPLFDMPETRALPRISQIPSWEAEDVYARKRRQQFSNPKKKPKQSDFLANAVTFAVATTIGIACLSLSVGLSVWNQHYSPAQVVVGSAENPLAAHSRKANYIRASLSARAPASAFTAVED